VSTPSKPSPINWSLPTSVHQTRNGGGDTAGSIPAGDAVIGGGRSSLLWNPRLWPSGTATRPHPCRTRPRNGQRIPSSTGKYWEFFWSAHLKSTTCRSNSRRENAKNGRKNGVKWAKTGKIPTRCRRRSDIHAISDALPMAYETYVGAAGLSLPAFILTHKSALTNDPRRLPRPARGARRERERATPDCMSMG
jgi:hypothetical protein